MELSRTIVGKADAVATYWLNHTLLHNVCEIENVVERGVLLAHVDQIDLGDLLFNRKMQVERRGIVSEGIQSGGLQDVSEQLTAERVRVELKMGFRSKLIGV